MANRSLLVHGGILALAAALAVRAWTKDTTVNVKDVAAELWKGTAGKVDRIEFETKSRHVVLEAQSDATGRYYVGTVEKTKLKQDSPPDPHAPPPVPPALLDPSAEKESTRFISSTQSESLVALLAPLRASRTLGKVDDARLAEFGFDQDHGTLRVTVGGEQHQLTLGGDTPGGSDVYVRDAATNEGYVISGSISSAFALAESKLIDRDFHAFTLDDVERVRLIQGNRSREIVKLADQKGFWANPATPTAKDETASNWMSKLDRLKVTAYVEKPDPEVKPEDLVVRVEFLGARNKPLGFLEMVKRPPAQNESRPEYYARSEQSRWYASVLRSAGEQLDQDLGSVLGE